MKKKLKNLIIKEISYDASLICRKCGQSDKSYWIDNKTSLAHTIAEFLGIKTLEILHSIINDASTMTQGKSDEDAEYIIQKIDDEVMGIPNK